MDRNYCMMYPVSTSMDRNYCMMYPVSDGVNNMEMDIGVR
jgi:hypothetical protein